MSRPFVFINMAMTADGKIANTNRKITTFGSREDHQRLLKLRTKADAILTGAGTLNAQPEITLGPAPGQKKAPARVIVSGSGQINPDDYELLCPTDEMPTTDTAATSRDNAYYTRPRSRSSKRSTDGQFLVRKWPDWDSTLSVCKSCLW